MKNLSLLVILLLPLLSEAQQKKAVTFQQQVQSQRAVRDAPRAIPETHFRILAGFDQLFTSPKELNDFRNDQLWVGTPAAGETFSALQGFNVGIGYKNESSVYSLELEQHGKKLSGAAVSTTTTVRDSIDVQTLQLVYDHVFQDSPEDSIELGIGAGMALKFHYINHITNSSIGLPDQETGVTWKSTPFVLKVRTAYNYYFSENVGVRVAVGYQYLVSDNLEAAENYNVTYFGIPVTSGKTLTDANNQNVKIDLSGVQLSAGLSVNF
jgi:hypothetical protein